jgi:hypothetical protein
MATVSRDLPERPHLDVPKREARELLDLCKKSDPDALERIRRRHPKFKNVTDDAAIASIKLSDAQLVVAREYGLSNWSMLKRRIGAHSAANALHAAIRADDREVVVSILRANPEMLYLPVWSGNLGTSYEPRRQSWPARNYSRLCRTRRKRLSARFCSRGAPRKNRVCALAA